MSVTFNDKLLVQIENAAKDGVADASNIYYNETLRLIMDTQKTGVVYTGAWGGPTGTHQASAPGEPFANKTGNAVQNIRRYEENSGLTEIIAAEAEYAGKLEFGDMNQAPRPVFRPAIDNTQQELINAIQSAVAKALK